MKFYLISIAYLAVVCGLSNAAKTQEELEREMMHLQCPSGKRPALIKRSCPTGGRYVVDCPAVEVGCVDRSFGNDQPSTTGTGTGFTGSRKSEEELDYELMHKQCPFGQRAALFKERCPQGVLNTLDCPPVQVKCVQSSFGNNQPDSPNTNGNRRPTVAKTSEDLEQELMHKDCPFGQRAALVKEKCLYGATDTLDCPPTEVRCYELSFGNDQPNTPETGSSGPRGPQKTEEELDQEMMNKECPFGQRPALVKEKCPSGVKNTLDCPPNEVRCVKSSFGNDLSNTSGTNNNRPKPAVSEEELEYALEYKKCLFGERAALVKEKCLIGSRHNIDCPPTEVRCVKSSSGNDD